MVGDMSFFGMTGETPPLLKRDILAASENQRA